MHFPLRPAQGGACNRHLHNIVQVAAGCWLSSEPCGTNAFIVQRAFCVHGHADVSQSLGVLQVAGKSIPGPISAPANHQTIRPLPDGCPLKWVRVDGLVKGFLLMQMPVSIVGDTPSAAAANWADCACWAEPGRNGRTRPPAWSSAGMCPCTQSGRRGHQRDRAAARPSRRRLEPRCPRGC